MYAQFFGLEREPFSMTPDPGALFMTQTHREALAGLTYAILKHKGFVILTGEAGTGKTTLLTRILQCVPSSRLVSSVILNPLLTPTEFLEMALLDFGVTDVPSSKTRRLLLLQGLLMRVHEDGRTAVLVVDEAHKLPAELLEEIRLLSNFELPQGKLLQIVLSGQDELGDLLNREELRQLKQRVAVRLSLQPLSAENTANYVQYRWSKAGGNGTCPFEAEALQLIAAVSHGVPRIINAVCDNALLLAFTERVTAVVRRHVCEAARDLDLHTAAEADAARLVPVRILAAPAAAFDGDGTGEILHSPFLDRWASPPPPSRLRRLAVKLGLAS